MTKEQIIERLAELDGYYKKEGWYRRNCWYKERKLISNGSSLLPDYLHPQKGYNPLQRIINNMGRNVVKEYQREIGCIRDRMPVQATTKQIAQAILHAFGKINKTKAPEWEI